MQHNTKYTPILFLCHLVLRSVTSPCIVIVNPLLTFISLSIISPSQWYRFSSYLQFKHDKIKVNLEALSNPYYTCILISTDEHTLTWHMVWQFSSIICLWRCKWNRETGVSVYSTQGNRKVFCIIIIVTGVCNDMPTPPKHKTILLSANITWRDCRVVTYSIPPRLN